MSNTLSLIVAGAFAVGCRTAGKPPEPGSDANRVVTREDSSKGSAVFRDSALHAQLCEPVPPGSDWRKMCTPKDQRVILVKPKSEPPK